MRLYGNIQKVDAEQRMVFGYASTEATDGHGETVLKSAIEASLDDYMEFANIREMHALSAVGVAEEASVDEKGLWIGAKIVDDVAWAKVTSGVYKGFSIGGKTLARDPGSDETVWLAVVLCWLCYTRGVLVDARASRLLSGLTLAGTERNHAVVADHDTRGRTDRQRRRGLRAATFAPRDHRS